MITVTEHAQKTLRQLLDQRGSYIGLRLAIHGDTLGAYQPDLFAMRKGDQSPLDTVYEYGDLIICLDPESAEKAEGLKIDVVPTPFGPRVRFEFPAPVWDDPVANRLQKLIDERINPGLLNHGGYVALLSVRDGVAEIMMGGGCQGCALSAQTLSRGIKAVITSEIPEIHTVIDKTDHDQGAHPYYGETDHGQKKSKSYRRRASRKRN